MTNLFQWGSVNLSSGQTSSWKIECDSLSTKDWQGLATIAVELFGLPGRVEGVPRGGNAFARQLSFYSTSTGPLWLVDDVLTTGASMTRQKGNREAFGVVAFARGKCPSWIHPIFQMPVATNE